MVCALVLSGCDQAGRPAKGGGAGAEEWPGYFVEIDWVAENSGRLVIVDVRSASAYARGHVPGAIHLPYDSLNNKAVGKEENLASLPRFEEVMGTAGITRDDEVVVYGEPATYAAARMVWAMDVYGHARTAVMLEGLRGWKEAGQAVETDPRVRQPVRYGARLHPDRIASRMAVKDAILKSEIGLIDVRIGAASRPERPGRIPSSLSVDLGEALMRPVDLESLRLMQEAMKSVVEQGKSYVVYCDSGTRSATTYLALRDLGVRAALYDGGWNEWAGHPNLPIEFDRPRHVRQEESEGAVREGNPL